VGLYLLASFYADQPPQQGHYLGYGAIDTLDIEPTLARVRDILLEMG
jgi:GntR family transcriptional regulator/MocR family aminotransferase